jgi:hypothetical protein
MAEGNGQSGSAPQLPATHRLLGPCERPTVCIDKIDLLSALEQLHVQPSQSGDGVGAAFKVRATGSNGRSSCRVIACTGKVVNLRDGANQVGSFDAPPGIHHEPKHASEQETADDATEQRQNYRTPRYTLRRYRQGNNDNEQRQCDGGS